MACLYGQSLFRCRYKKRTCKPLNNTNVFEYRILTKHMPVECTGHIQPIGGKKQSE
jgi:hypothetical protein